MYCSKCGATLAVDAMFCQSCGTPAGRAILARPAAAVSPLAGVGAIPYATQVSYAGFWLRVAAYLIDGLILGVVITVLFVPLFILMGGIALLEGLRVRNDAPANVAQVAALLTLLLSFAAVALLIKWLYYAYLESGEKQATWGKQVLGLYVTDLTGQRVSFGRASARFFAMIVTGMIPLGIGFIMAGFTERRQALHDMIASALVLKR